MWHHFWHPNHPNLDPQAQDGKQWVVDLIIRNFRNIAKTDETHLQGLWHIWSKRVSFSVTCAGWVYLDTSHKAWVHYDFNELEPSFQPRCGSIIVINSYQFSKVLHASLLALGKQHRNPFARDPHGCKFHGANRLCVTSRPKTEVSKNADRQWDGRPMEASKLG